MKQLRFVQLLFVFSMLVVTGCEKLASGDKDEPRLQSAATDIESVITVTEGKFVAEAIPETSVSVEKPQITSVIGNSHIVNGGVSVIRINSDDQFSKAIVAIKGEDTGYYEIANISKKSGNNLSFPILIGEQVEESLTLVFAIVNDQGLVSDYEEFQAAVVQTQGGVLQINCSWDLMNDVDLHVVAPDGNEIYFGNRGLEYDFVGIYNHFLGLELEEVTSLDTISLTIEQQEIMRSLTMEDFADFIILQPGGSLDIDSNAGCNIDGVNSENIIFQTGDLQVGEYIVRVDFYNDCIGAGVTNFVVSAKLNGMLLDIDTENPVSGSFNSGEHDFGSSGAGVEVMRFSISESQVQTATAVKKRVAANYREISSAKFTMESVLNQRKKAVK